MTRIIICGKAASGKDALKKLLIYRGFKSEVSYTTRPIREGEIDGVDYHFITKEKFMGLVEEGQFLQHKEFRGWYYGTTKEEWNTKNLFIMTPEGIYDIPENDREKCFIIYIDTPEAVRKRRLQERNDADDVQRRLKADQEQFGDFTSYDIVITGGDIVNHKLLDIIDAPNSPTNRPDDWVAQIWLENFIDNPISYTGKLEDLKAINGEIEIKLPVNDYNTRFIQEWTEKMINPDGSSAKKSEYVMNGRYTLHSGKTRFIYTMFLKDVSVVKPESKMITVTIAYDKLDK